MKTVTLLSFAAVTVAALVTLLGNASLSAVIPCAFLVLIAAGDYGPKKRHGRFRSTAYNQNSGTRTSSSHPYRLAA